MRGRRGDLGAAAHVAGHQAQEHVFSRIEQLDERRRSRKRERWPIRDLYLEVRQIAIHHVAKIGGGSTDQRQPVTHDLRVSAPMKAHALKGRRAAVKLEERPIQAPTADPGGPQESPIDVEKNQQWHHEREGAPSNRADR